MNRVALILDAGDGQEALLFSSQRAAQEWIDKHPAADEATQGLVPLSTRPLVLRKLTVTA